jgi:chromate transport protein ChrA
MMKNNDIRNGIYVAIISFFIVALPYALIMLFIVGFNEDSVARSRGYIYLVVELGAYLVICSLLGLGVAKKSKRLMAISAFLVIAFFVLLMCLFFTS